MRSGLAASVLAELARRGETLASAESLTGGMVGQLLTDVPGASASYLGGVISYATDLKATLAGVNVATLDQLGPVSERTAAEMARGVAERCNADWGVATTGVAGPEAQGDHPVGQVFIAVSHQTDGVISVRELSLHGERAAIRKQAAEAALALLADALGLSSPSFGTDDAPET
ncbi:MAG TPA: nicotinamide-nucleotide amidohydrolase family protein [Propionibacteriaceae bacterium]|nr:nicotinamide-nucleotide amidohydrolase family protein [Propionibacteriaceae bacterium]